MTQHNGYRKPCGCRDPLPWVAFGVLFIYMVTGIVDRWVTFLVLVVFLAMMLSRKRW